MILTAQTVHTILNYITKPNTIYDDIINNILSPNLHHKNELISELAISFLGNKSKVNKSLKEGWFNYYFISAVKNQVHSSTSPFHKNVRKTINYTYNNDYPIEEIEHLAPEKETQIQEKELLEKQYKELNKALDKVKCNWFEKEIFNLYYNENYTYRQIEREYNIDHVLAFNIVKKLKTQIKKQINKSDI